MNKQRPSVFGAATAPEPSVMATADSARVEAKTTPAKGEGEMFRTSLYLSRAVHDKLREIAFHEGCKVHELFMEGIDTVLTKRGYATSAELKGSKA